MLSFREQRWNGKEVKRKCTYARKKKEEYEQLWKLCKRKMTNVTKPNLVASNLFCSFYFLFFFFFWYFSRLSPNLLNINHILLDVALLAHFLKSYCCDEYRHVECWHAITYWHFQLMFHTFENWMSVLFCSSYSHSLLLLVSIQNRHVITFMLVLRSQFHFNNFKCKGGSVCVCRDRVWEGGKNIWVNERMMQLSIEIHLPKCFAAAWNSKNNICQRYNRHTLNYPILLLFSCSMMNNMLLHNVCRSINKLVFKSISKSKCSKRYSNSKVIQKHFVCLFRSVNVCDSSHTVTVSCVAFLPSVMCVLEFCV